MSSQGDVENMTKYEWEVSALGQQWIKRRAWVIKGKRYCLERCQSFLCFKIFFRRFSSLKYIWKYLMVGPIIFFVKHYFEILFQLETFKSCLEFHSNWKFDSTHFQIDHELSKFHLLMLFTIHSLQSHKTRLSAEAKFLAAELIKTWNRAGRNRRPVKNSLLHSPFDRISINLISCHSVGNRDLTDFVFIGCIYRISLPMYR